MMNHRGENKQDTAIIIISFISAPHWAYIPAASRGYFDYKQSRVERECERAHSPVCELAAPRVRRGQQRSFVSRFLSPYIYAFYNAWTFCPRFCTHNLCRHILSFVCVPGSAGRRNRAGAKEIAQLDLHVTSMRALLAFGLEIFWSFWRHQKEFFTSLHTISRSCAEASTSWLLCILNVWIFTRCFATWLFVRNQRLRAQGNWSRPFRGWRKWVGRRRKTSAGHN